MAKRFQSDRWNRKRRLKKDKEEQRKFAVTMLVAVVVLALAFISFQGNNSLRYIGHLLSGH